MKVASSAVAFAAFARAVTASTCTALENPTCVSCAEIQGCAWCGKHCIPDTAECKNGSIDDSFGCPFCEDLEGTNCVTCTNAMIDGDSIIGGCTWCDSTKKCVPTGTGENANKECDSNPGINEVGKCPFEWAKGTCEAIESATCETCTSSDIPDGCVWCDSTNTCVTPGTGENANKECDSNPGITDSSNCTAKATCADIKDPTCATCTKADGIDGGCVWCDSKKTCVTAGTGENANKECDSNPGITDSSKCTAKTTCADIKDPTCATCTEAKVDGTEIDGGCVWCETAEKCVTPDESAADGECGANDNEITDSSKCPVKITCESIENPNCGTCTLAAVEGGCVYCAGATEEEQGTCVTPKGTDNGCTSGTGIQKPADCAGSCTKCTGGSMTFQLIYAEDAVVASCLNKDDCAPNLVPVDTSFCYGDCANVPIEYSVGNASYAYNASSCFTKRCTDCVASEDPVCQYASLDGAARCVPENFLDGVEIVTECPAEADGANGLYKTALVGLVALLAAFAV